jgi:hypothetical protein
MQVAKRLVSIQVPKGGSQSAAFEHFMRAESERAIIVLEHRSEFRHPSERHRSNKGPCKIKHKHKKSLLEALSSKRAVSKHGPVSKRVSTQVVTP